MARVGTKARKTTETDVRVEVDLDGQGQHRIATPIGFLTHMLEQLSKHSLIDLVIDAQGDVEVDGHHTTEDVAFTLGCALLEAVGDGRGIHRHGWATIPMDEACVTCCLDLSGRPFFVFEPALPPGRIGDFDGELCEVFLEGLARGARMNLHVHRLAGRNLHHMVEVTFKALAKALRQAVAIDPRQTGIPSTKGTIGP